MAIRVHSIELSFKLGRHSILCQNKSNVTPTNQTDYIYYSRSVSYLNYFQPFFLFKLKYFEFYDVFIVKKGDKSKTDSWNRIYHALIKKYVTV